MNLKRGVILAALAGLLSYGYWSNHAPRTTPAGQPPMVSLTSANLDEFRRDFNAHADVPRLMLLVSPT